VRSRIVALGIAFAVACAPQQQDAAAGAEARGTVAATAAAPASYQLGRAPQPADLAAWDIDVNPDGVGLPSGRGSAVEGIAVYNAKCASCHGAKGEGVPPNPPIAAHAPSDSFAFGRDPKLVKTVGNYWPYATTVFDYVQRAMPQDKPGSLTPNELYAVTAWILAENGIIARDAVMDSLSLPKVRMPARDRFVRDDRLTTTAFR
jgi:cytochrome c